MPSEYLIQPWKHQLEAIERASLLDHYALLFEMGAGKTGTAINILRDKFNSHRRVLRTLVFCPPIVVPNWRDEWAKHSRLDPSKVVLLRGSGRERLKKFLEKAYSPEGLPQGVVFVTNYESLLMPDLLLAFQEWSAECVVLDESHKCKDIQAKRTKLAHKLINGVFKKNGECLVPPIRYRYILTGTPVLNSPMDIFSQFLLLDNGRTFGKNFFAFRAQYFEDENAAWKGRQKYFPKWVIRPGMLEVMNAKIKLIGMRVKKDDCLDLPPLIRQKIAVGMTTEQSRMYQEMKRDFVTFLKDKAFTASLAITKALRLQQIASGFCTSHDGHIISLGLTPRQEALKELLSEITPHSKVLVWAVWRENYAQIRQVCDEIGVGYVEVHGGISDRQKHENVDLFKTEDRVRVFIGHPGSGGIGINLVNAPYAVFFSRSFSLEFDKQAEARNHRGGSEIHEKITRYDLVAEGTIDEVVEQKLVDKTGIGEAMLGELIASLQK